MGLILSQDGEFFTDFIAVLKMKPESHPKTWRVLNIASLIGSFAVLYFKSKYDLPRPTQSAPHCCRRSRPGSFPGEAGIPRRRIS